ncbi:hypothetical protein [Sphingobacterium chuzhouense]|uniref:Uncharacterized protein n=1 Tax=Sphingobacterium chuzhouense TaxID=1742264 RepID=A0ABR7XPD3_9SPHI|nr:hypothetical protein [Sphingobacterium chuzhouense]MBD1421020.1 hypothetical protein [Sphingobacterium chuzhouense]
MTNTFAVYPDQLFSVPVFTHHIGGVRTDFLVIVGDVTVPAERVLSDGFGSSAQPFGQLLR